MIAREDRQVLTLKQIEKISRSRRESAIQASVLAVLRAHGILCWPQNREKGGRNRASHVGFRGLPDIGGILPDGRAIQVEVKRPGQSLSIWQRSAHELLRSQHAVVFTVTSIDETRTALLERGLARR